MARKRKPTVGSVRRSYKRLQRDLKDLTEVERELTKVSANLRKFLDQVEVLSGFEYFIERRKKLLRTATRRR